MRSTLGIECMQRDDDTALYVMSVAAELTRGSPQTLRLYERKRLLEPARSARVGGVATASGTSRGCAASGC
jgi:hypothetical protein